MTKKVSTPQELRQHALQIAGAFGVALMENSMMKADQALAAHQDFHNKHTKESVTMHAVLVAPIVCEATYAIAMHELGHCCAFNGTLKVDRKELVLLQENAAWDWAVHYSLDWTPTMEHIRVQALATYERGQVRRRQEVQQTAKQAERQRVAEAQKDVKRASALKGFRKKIGL